MPNQHLYLNLLVRNGQILHQSVTIYKAETLCNTGQASNCLQKFTSAAGTPNAKEKQVSSPKHDTSCLKTKQNYLLKYLHIPCCFSNENTCNNMFWAISAWKRMFLHNNDWDFYLQDSSWTWMQNNNISV